MTAKKADLELDALRERRAVLAEMLKHPALLAPKAYAELEKEYKENGEQIVALVEAEAGK